MSRSVMKTMLFGLGIALIAFAVGFVVARRIYAPRPVLPSPEYERGSLRWRIQQAKVKGEQMLQIASIIDYASGFEHPQEALKEALSYYSVIVAEPLEKKSYVNDDSINSWYRFKVIEILNQKPLSECPGCFNPPDPPSDLLPVKDDELLIIQAGGAMTLDDLYVVDNSSRPYALSQKYLLFVRPDNAKRTASVTLGPIGVYEVTRDEFLAPFTVQQSALSQFIQTHYCNSLERLRVAIKQELRSH
jgi:hypothetical protein